MLWLRVSGFVLKTKKSKNAWVNSSVGGGGGLSWQHGHTGENRVVTPCRVRSRGFVAMPSPDTEFAVEIVL